MGTIRWIRNTIGKRFWVICTLGLLQSLLAVGGILFALLLRQGINGAVNGQGRIFYQSIVALIILILVQLGLQALNRFLDDDVRAAIENQLRRKTFRGVLKQKYEKINQYHTGELMNRITADASIVTDGAVTLPTTLLSTMVRICGALYVMYRMEPWIAIVFLCGGCVVAALSAFPRKWQKVLHKRVRESDGNVRSFLQESIESMIVIRAFGNEEKIENDGQKKMTLHRKMRRKQSHLFNVLGTGLRFFLQCGYVFGFVWCGVGIIQNKISYGDLVAVLQLVGQIQAPFTSIGGILPKYTSMLASAERLIELTEGEDAQKDDSIEKSREEIYDELKSIHFQEVSFAYNSDRKVLEKETFTVNKGEFLGIIGSSGIGKSTVMKLLLSVYQPDEGRIVAQLEDEEVGIEELPSGMFAYVPQGNYLMGGTIWEVVGFAEKSENIDLEKVKEACQIACAHEFIEKLPQGYDTVLGERGSGLSEGQMQRLAVARAIYSGCPILLLDEATSALDADTERRLISSLKNLKNYTVFLVTHRKDVWELCDRILERKE